MCYVAAATSKSDGTTRVNTSVIRGALVAVTSAGGVSVWGVPALEDVREAGEGEGAAAVDVPLLARHSVKV